MGELSVEQRGEAAAGAAAAVVVEGLRKRNVLSASG